MGNLRESIVRKSLEGLQPNLLLDHLNEAQLEDDELLELLGLLLRSNHLIFKYPSPNREKLRDHYVHTIRSWFDTSGRSDGVEAIDFVIGRIKLAEEGYRIILDALNSANLNQMSAEQQSSALICRALEQLDLLHQRALQSIRPDTMMVGVNDPTVTDEFGRSVSVDAGVQAFVSVLGMSLEMLGHSNKWIDEGGHIVIPDPGTVDEDSVLAIGTMELLGHAWQGWQRLEQRARYWGGSLRRITDKDLPPGSPSSLRVLFSYKPDGSDLYDWVANERLRDLEVQRLGHLLLMKAEGSDFSANVALPPEEYLNVAEIASGTLLSELLAVPLQSDSTFAGLRLAEWVRGYSALRELASEARDAGDSTDTKHLVRIGDGELMDTLERLGLPSDAARGFIDLATFSTRGEDLFDCPLIKLRGGGYLLFGPAASDSNPAQLVQSAFASLDVRVDEKGSGFEANVHTLFQGQGLQTFSIDTTRNGEAYEVDVLVPWDGYLFVIECKNRSLSRAHPIQGYWFERERQNSVRQIKRQVRGLIDYPDMLTSIGGPDLRSLKIIPVVLYSLPYALPGETDGVHVADYSGLSRFFQERHFTIQTPHDVGRGNRIIHRTLMHPQWSGEEPAAGDLLRHLRDPLQVRIMANRASVHEIGFQMASDTAGMTREYIREELSLEELGKELGFDGKQARKTIKQVRRAAKRAHKEHLDREVRLAERRWREAKKRKS